MKVMLIAGARPNFMKVAPVMAALLENGHVPVLVHTGQHYDYRMSQAFFEDLSIPEPSYFLRVGSGSHAAQTAAVMTAFEPVLLDEHPDWVLVPGDVNSTLACALVTVKLTETLGSRLAHLEAGLRSRDWRMPEEANRVLTDHCSDLLLTPSADADHNLMREGVHQDRIVFVGNIMIDTLYRRIESARRLKTADRYGLGRHDYVAVTLHRPSNVDDRDTFATVLEGLREVAKNQPVLLPLHPRTRKNAQDFGLVSLLDSLICTDPLPYTEMLSIVESAAMVFTDSGGLQEETTVLGIPCVTLREQTERPITVTAGTNRMIPWPMTAQHIVEAHQLAAAQPRRDFGTSCPPGWDGGTAQRVVAALAEHLTAPGSWHR